MEYGIKCHICHKDKGGDCNCRSNSLKNLTEVGKINSVNPGNMKVEDLKQSKYLMDLPDDVLIKILGYVVPVLSCGDCFVQRTILRLGRVNKRMHALSKV